MAGGRFSTVAAQQASQTTEASFSAHPLEKPDGINTELASLDKIANGGRFILFGDNHFDTSGHQALVNLMPTLQRSHVTTLGLELPPSMNDYLAGLQNNVRHGATPDDLFKSLKTKMSTATGGDQNIHDFANIIHSATMNGIKVAAIDARDVAQHPDIVNHMRAKAFAEDDPIMFGHDVTRLDKETAHNAYQHIAGQPLSRMAIMFGQAHSCRDDGDRLGDALQDYGTVTKISLVQPKHMEETAAGCKNMDIHTTVNGVALNRDVHRHALPKP
jgi:hypothetical protein